MALRGKAFENIVVKGENAGNQHFLLFSAMFSTQSKTKISIILSSENTFNLIQSKMLSLGKELIHFIAGLIRINVIVTRGTKFLRIAKTVSRDLVKGSLLHCSIALCHARQYGIIRCP